MLRAGRNILAEGPLSTPLAIGLIAVLFGCTIGIAWLTFSFVERPVTRRVGSYLRRRRTETTGQDQVAAPVTEAPPAATTAPR